MDISAVESLLAIHPSTEGVDELLHNASAIFWIDWREEDDRIPGICEGVLQTGSLRGEWVDSKSGGEVVVYYAGNRIRVPLVYGHADRHTTLRAMNKLMYPDFEVRFCVDSDGGDTLAFCPLPCNEWWRLEAEYPEATRLRFEVLRKDKNLFG